MSSDPQLVLTAEGAIEMYELGNFTRLESLPVSPNDAPSPIFEEDAPMIKTKSTTQSTPRFDLTISYANVTAIAIEKKIESVRLQNVSGVVKPGEMTLIIAGPGNGKSSLLRMMANRMEITSGDICYNGHTVSEASSLANCDISKMVQYLEQTDAHIPLLTVQETLDFVQKVGSVNRDSDRVEKVLQMLGLTGCRDTIVGNDLIRGVSGGERRRVSIAEALLTDACALLLDEYTNGLDSVTSENITASLRDWVHTTNGCLVATVQQPTPKLFSMYDNIIVLKDSSVVYHGPRVNLLTFFKSLGFVCPDDVDICDFIIDCVSQPITAFKRQAETRAVEIAKGDVGKFAELSKTITQCSDKKSEKSIDQSVDNKSVNWHWIINADEDQHEVTCNDGVTVQIADSPCFTTQQIVEHYEKTVFYEAIISQISPKKVDTNSSSNSLITCDAMREMYSTGYSHPLTHLCSSVIIRKFKLASRNKMLFISRLTQTTVLALIVGSIFYQIETDSYFERIALLSFLMNCTSYTAISELNSAVETARVVYKQAASSMYPVWTHVLSNILTTSPLNFIEVSVVMLIVYMMADNVRTGAAFFTAWIVVLLQQICCNTLFHMLTGINNTETTALGIASPVIGILFFTSGLFVTRSNMQSWMSWLYYISPFSWSLRALVNNEFDSPRYPNSDALLESFDFWVGSEWIGYCVLYLVGLIILMLLNHARLMKKPFFELSRGTKRNEDKEVTQAEEPVSTQAEPSGKRGQLHTLTNELKFVPTSLTFTDVYYTVKVTDDTGTQSDKVLLNNVNGHALPGTLTALMGASGAGKTTLMDLLAGRKDTGVVEGSIKMNGVELSGKKRSKITGYVEQFDNLPHYFTVRELFLFVAKMRLGFDVSIEVKEKIADEIIDILDLTDITDSLIGDATNPSLSPSQLKRVNIGVELVANPSVLFLDEPTTGLDSKAATTVMRVVRRIARSGRSVVCTIHQPSAELFYMFDNLVLMAPGGLQVYFGPLGPRSNTFIDYLQAIPGVQPVETQYNPASWMLEELNRAPDDKSLTFEQKRNEILAKHRLFKEHYMSSSTYTSAIDVIDQTNGKSSSIEIEVDPTVENTTDENVDVSSSSSSTTSTENEVRTPLTLWQQYVLLQKRSVLSYLRAPKALIGRFMTFALLSVIFGLIYLDIQPTTQTSALSALAARCNIVSFNSIIHATTCTAVFMNSRAYVYKEKVSGMYNAVLYILSTIFTEIILCAIDAIFLQVPIYFMANFMPTAEAFFKYFFTVFIVNCAIVTFCIFATTLFASPALVGVVQSAYITLGVFFSGLSIRYGKSPVGWRFMFYILPLGRASEAVGMSQFEICDDLPNCGPMINVLGGNGYVPTHLPRFISDYLGYDFGRYWEANAVIIASFVGFGILACYCMHKFTHRKS